MTFSKFVVVGAPRVKKNTGKVVGRGKFSKKIDSPAYTAWKNGDWDRPGASRQLADIRDAMEREGKWILPIAIPIEVAFEFYIDQDRIVDMSALYEGIQDEMTAAGIILDDNQRIIKSHDGSRVYIDRKNPRIVVMIRPFVEVL